MIVYGDDINIHDSVTYSTNHSHLEVRADQIPGPVHAREGTGTCRVISQTLLSPQRMRITEGSGNHVRTQR